MFPSAKATAAFAVALGGCEVAWREVHDIAGQPGDALRLICAHLYLAARTVGAALGVTAVVVLFILAVDLLFLGWRGSSLFRLAFKRSNSAVLDILNAILLVFCIEQLIPITWHRQALRRWPGATWKSKVSAT